jgi:hypothetical protein
MAFNKFFNDKKTEIIRTCRKELIQIKNWFYNNNLYDRKKIFLQ